MSQQLAMILRRPEGVDVDEFLAFFRQLEEDLLIKEEQDGYTEDTRGDVEQYL